MAKKEPEPEPQRDITVERGIPIEIDVGRMGVFDGNPIPDYEGEEEEDRVLESVARDGAQVMINQLISLPVTRGGDEDNDHAVYVQLAEPRWKLPRAKHVPKDKPLTKWQEFAAKKGIKPKRKQGKLEYSEEDREWIPKFGYGGKGMRQSREWLVEVNDKDNKDKSTTSDEVVDPRSLSRQERKLMVKKNQKRQERNLQRQQQ